MAETRPSPRISPQLGFPFASCPSRPAWAVASELKEESLLYPFSAGLQMSKMRQAAEYRTMLQMSFVEAVNERYWWASGSSVIELTPLKNLRPSNFKEAKLQLTDGFLVTNSIQCLFRGFHPESVPSPYLLVAPLLLGLLRGLPLGLTSCNLLSTIAAVSS